MVGMAGQGVQVNSAKLSQDLPGVYTVAFQIPEQVIIGTGDLYILGGFDSSGF